MQIIETAKGMYLFSQFNQHLSNTAHIPQQMWGTQFLSWSPLLQPKRCSYAYFIKRVIVFFCDFELHSIQNESGELIHFLHVAITTQSQTKKHDKCMILELAKTNNGMNHTCN